MNKPELGAGINPGMAFNPFPSSILDKTRQDSNPQPLDRELSLDRTCAHTHAIFFFQFSMPKTKIEVYICE
jgi:hypothetical protein